MKIKDLHLQKKPVVSFEIFPPKEDTKIETIYSTIEELAHLKPDFISVTYSAGGSGSSSKTAEIASAIKNQYGVEALAHLTCINSDKAFIESVIKELEKNGIENVLALRGDKIEGSTRSDFQYAKDLIKKLKTEADFCIGAGAYPEGHIECDDFDLSLRHLKEKEESGADFLITQLFFDNSYFYNFVEKARKIGITLPISAGIMPILSKNQIARMIFMCGASLPAAIVRLLNKYEQNPEDLRKAGIEYASLQLIDLIGNGVEGVHIYTMNKPDIAKSQMKRIKGEGHERG